jgi:hypothetical protein
MLPFCITKYSNKWGTQSTNVAIKIKCYIEVLPKQQAMYTLYFALI